MISPAHSIHYGFADYLALEASSNVKHDFLDGQIYGLAGEGEQARLPSIGAELDVSDLYSAASEPGA